MVNIKKETKLDVEGNKIMVAKKPNISCIPHSKEKLCQLAYEILKLSILLNSCQLA